MRGVSSESKNDLLHKSLDGFSFSRRAALLIIRHRKTKIFRSTRIDDQTSMMSVYIWLEERKSEESLAASHRAPLPLALLAKTHLRIALQVALRLRAKLSLV